MTRKSKMKKIEKAKKISPTQYDVKWGKRNEKLKGTCPWVTPVPRGALALLSYQLL